MRTQGTGNRDQGSGARPTVPGQSLNIQKKSHWEGLRGPGFILLSAVIAVGPQIAWGNSCGHDFNFHFISWLDCLNAWRHGILYPHWAPSANFGAGEPRFVFYPPLTWMLGAALGAVLPWQAVPIALTFLLLAATGLATRALAREMLPEGAATLAGCAALFSGYALFTAYERTAFAELTGGFWIPLLLLFALRERNPSGPAWRHALDGSAVPLAFVVAGAWLSNVPVGLMSAYLLAVVALGAALLAKSWAPILRALTSTALGLGVAALYIIPVAREQRWVSLVETIQDAAYQFRNSWLFAQHADPALAEHDVVLRQVSWIASGMLFVAIAALLVVWRRGTLPANRRWRILLAATPFVILFLLLPISQPLWLLLPQLRFLQFPWRWLVALEAPMAIPFSAAVWPDPSARRWKRWAVIAAATVVLMAAGLFTIYGCFQSWDGEDSVAGLVSSYRSGMGFPGTDEYAPPNADNSLVATSLPVACLVRNPAALLGDRAEPRDDGAPLDWNPAQGSCLATFAAAQDSSPEDVHITAATTEAGYMVLRLRSYPAWRVTVNGEPASNLPARDDGLMTVPVPQGRVHLAIDWTTTPDSLAGRWLSTLAVLLLTTLCLLERRLNRPRLE